MLRGAVGAGAACSAQFHPIGGVAATLVALAALLPIGTGAAAAATAVTAAGGSSVSSSSRIIHAHPGPAALARHAVRACGITQRASGEAARRARRRARCTGSGPAAATGEVASTSSLERPAARAPAGPRPGGARPTPNCTNEGPREATGHARPYPARVRGASLVPAEPGPG